MTSYPRHETRNPRSPAPPAGFAPLAGTLARAAERRVVRPQSFPSALAVKVGLLLAVLASSVEAQIVAVLENPQCKSEIGRMVRPLFAKTPRGWVSLSESSTATQLPAKWFVTTRAGRSRVITTTAPASLPEPSWTYSRDYLLTPSEPFDLPIELNSTQSFAGWCSVPVGRPVLITSGAAVAPAAIIASAKHRPKPRALVNAFTLSLGDRQLCDQESKKIPRLKDSDIAVRNELLLPDGKRLVALALTRDVTECESEVGEIGQPRWFLWGKVPTFIGTSLDFVAAADFDADNGLEYVFWYSAYNEDGYILFDSALTELRRFTWHYH